MQYSTHFNMNKPEPADQYNLSHWNENTDILDTVIQQEINARINLSETVQNEINARINLSETVQNEINARITADTAMRTLTDSTLKQSIFNYMFPIGSIYQNKTDNRNPNTIFGFGTWEQITDKFLVSRGSTFTSTGGASSYTLTAANIPQHQHEMQHTHTISHTHTQQGTFATISQSASVTTTESANHSHSANIGVVFADGDNLGITGGQAELYIPNITGISSGGWVNVPATTYGNYTVPLGAAAGRSNVYRMLSLNVNMGVESASHTHQLVHGHNLSISGNTTEPSTPNSGNASREYTGYWGEPTVTAINTIPPYQAVYTWFRKA